MHNTLLGSVALILFKVKMLIFAIIILKICSNITVFQNRSFYKPFISNWDLPWATEMCRSCYKSGIRQFKYLNNIVEQAHRNIKRRISIDTGFKEFDSAQRTLVGIEVVNIIRKGQIADSRKKTFKTFCSLAA